MSAPEGRLRGSIWHPASAVVRNLLTSVLAVGAATVLAGPAASLQPPSGNLTAPAPADPAAVVFTTDAGMMLHAVKAGSVTDYEAAIAALQGALAKADAPETRAVAAGWRVYRAAEADAKSNVLYVHMLMPAIAGTDYRPSLWLDDLLAGAPPDLLAKYRDAFAAAPTKLSLTEFADMTVAPAPRPTNATPDAPVSNGSPSQPLGGTPPR